MSDNSPAIYGIPQTVSLPVGDIGIGSYIVNDYLITVADSEDGNGYLLTIKKGSQIQTIHLTELKQEAIDTAISLALAEAKESGEFDGNGIERAVLNSDYTLTLYFTDGTSVTTTSIRGETGNGIQSVVMNPDYTLTITFTDGDIYTTGSIRGLTGNGISAVVLNPDYTLTIRYTDGNSYTTTSVRGAKGDTGVSISGIIFNSDYSLTIECSDGSSYTTESIRGENGETGTGISSARLNDDFTLTLNFDDGNSYTTRSIRGETGAKGEKGDPGESFEIHACTSTEYDYDTGIPTIENPRANCLYLVPSSDAVTTDLFVEWVYIYGRWEKFGSAEINLDAYAKKTEVAAKLDKPLRDGLSGQILVSNGSGGQTWNDLPVPDWNAANGTTGFIRNKPDLKSGTGVDSVVNRHSLVSGSHSMAVGTNNTASGSDNFVTGNGNNAKGSGSILSGDHNTAELRGSNSVVGGSNNVVSGNCSFAVGNNNTASGAYSSVEGYHTIASGDSSHAEGKDTTASGKRSHAEGSATTASGTNSHAEGGNTESAAYYSHAEGYGTSATGSTAHAEGNTTTASGINSHAEGTNTLASGINSHAEGQFSIANHKSQHVFGENNIEDQSTAAVSARGNYVEIVGNGYSSNDRSNARTLDWNGNEWIAGNLKIGGNSYDDPDAKTVGPIDDTAGSGDTNVTWSAYKISSELANSGTNIVKGSWNDRNLSESKFVFDDSSMTNEALIEMLTESEDGVVLEVTFPAKTNEQGTTSIDERRFTFTDRYTVTYSTSDVIQTQYRFYSNEPVDHSTYAIHYSSYILLVHVANLPNNQNDMYMWVYTDNKFYVYVDDYENAISSSGDTVNIYSDKIAFNGLAKAAGDTSQASSQNPIGTYTDTAKTKIKQMLGIGRTVHGIKGTWNPNASADSKFVFDDTSMTNALLNALLANNTDDVFVLNINFPYVSGQDTVNSSYQRYFLVDKRTETWTNSDTVAVTYVFYSGDVSILEINPAQYINSYISFTRVSSQSGNSYYWGYGNKRFDVQVNGTSVVGQDGVAEIPVASGNNQFGLTKADTNYGTHVYSTGVISVYAASSASVKAGSNSARPICCSNQHVSVFYGLSKVAGVDLANETVTVGTYPDNAKASIKAMLGVGGETQKVTVSGTAPVIVANQNTRYVCGEVLSLDFTPSAEGICDVIFTSGSTVTVLTIPNTVIFPEWFDPTALEANKTYEISVSDGVYGAVMVW